MKQKFVVEEMTAILHFLTEQQSGVYGPKRVLHGRGNSQIVWNKSKSKNVLKSYFTDYKIKIQSGIVS